MTKPMAVLIIGALVMVPWLPAQTAPLRFTFIGNAAVMVTDGTHTLITDFPYESGAFGYMTYDRAAVQPAGAVTVLVTHEHRDHFVPSLLEGTPWTVLAPPGITPPIAADRLASVDSLAALGIQVTAITTPHARIAHRSYRVTWHGRSMYFTGDTEDVAPLLTERGLDVAFVTPWLFKASVSRGATIDARQVVIYHHTSGEAVPGCTGRCRVPTQGARWQ